MSASNESEVGKIAWVDLTVPNADEIRDFYEQVVGWSPEPVAMGEYSDFNMRMPSTRTPAAGVCFARGANANVPPQWIIYVGVADLDQSVARCKEMGGEVIDGPRGGCCIIRDPAGAVLALCAPPS